MSVPMWTGLIWLRASTSGGTFEHSKGFLGFIKDVKLL
jgi:hypothetical protein